MSSYKCKSCDNIVNGFHDCKKVISTYKKKCGCEQKIEEGFEDIYSVYWTEFEYIFPCKDHKNVLEEFAKKHPDMSYEKILDTVIDDNYSEKIIYSKSRNDEKVISK